MIAVIFEVQIAEGQKAEYLQIAEQLKPQLEQVEGFQSVERFQSLSDPDKLLSLSFFEDEAAVMRWRALEDHRTAQSRGREGVFANYRLRVAAVLRDYGMAARAQAPKDSLSAHG